MKKKIHFGQIWKQLTPEQRRYFQIKQGIITPTELGLKKYRGQAGIWEFRFGSNGRALLCFLTEVELGELHIIWLRPHRGISQEQLPWYIAFFEFVHNMLRRGKALLPSLLSSLLAP